MNEICISHADDLLKAGCMVKDDYPNIAYHLATLALEEIGKAEMLLVGQASIDTQKGNKFKKAAGEDHIKKIFWALWGPTFGSKDMSGKQIQAVQDLAKNIHLFRLRGLYVDIQKGFILPRKLISPLQTQKLIDIVSSRINLAKEIKIKEPNKDVINDLEWFHNAIEDTSKKQLIFGNKSIKKLKELDGNSKEWIKWLKGVFEESEKYNKEFLEKELDRKEIKKEEERKEKWNVKIKLVTPSHSVRQSVCNKFNKKGLFIKLNTGKKRGKICDVILDLKVPKLVPLNSLWHSAWGTARSFAVSLSIASRGYFWWYLPQDIDKYYESIKDLENDAEVKVERRPKLNLDWGNNVLSESDLDKAMLCFGLLPRDNVEFLNRYVAGLSFWGKNDIHTPLELDVFFHFYHSLLSAFSYYEKKKADGTLEASLEKRFNELIPNATFPAELLSLAKQSILKNTDKKITLTECGGMKILCDIYILSNIYKEADKRAASKKDNR